MKYCFYNHSEINVGEIRIEAESIDVAKEIAIKRMMFNLETFLRSGLTGYVVDENI